MRKYSVWLVVFLCSLNFSCVNINNWNRKSGDVTFKIESEVPISKEELLSVFQSRFNLISNEGIHIETINNHEFELSIFGIDLEDTLTISYLITKKGELGFYETYTIQEVFPLLVDVNNILIFLEIDKDTSSVIIEDTNLLFESLEKQNAELNPDFLANNPLFRYLSVNTYYEYDQPVFHDPITPLIGYVYSRDTSTINRYLNIPEVKSLLPSNMVFKWTAKKEEDHNGDKVLVGLVALKADRYGKPVLDETSIEKIKVSKSQYGESVIDIKMNEAAAMVWAKLTELASYDHRCIAIVVDEEVYSFPRVASKISNGNSQISGGFSEQIANSLGVLLNSEKMKYYFRIKETHIGTD